MTRESAVVAEKSGEQRRRIAGEFLLRARDDYERAKRTRLAYILNAREYGMTFREIGELLGLTEGGVRQIIARSSGGEDD